MGTIEGPGATTTLGLCPAKVGPAVPSVRLPIVLSAGRLDLSTRGVLSSLLMGKEPSRIRRRRNREGSSRWLNFVDSAPRDGSPAYQGNGCPRWKYPPVGPLLGSVASAAPVLPPSLSSIVACGPPMSVFTQPGCAEFTLIFVSRSSYAR